MSDTYASDLKKATESKSKLEGLIQQKQAAQASGQPSTKYDFLIKSARLTLNEDVGLLERHRHIYQFGS